MRDAALGGRYPRISVFDDSHASSSSSSSSSASSSSHPQSAEDAFKVWVPSAQRWRDTRTGRWTTAPRRGEAASSSSHPAHSNTAASGTSVPPPPVHLPVTTNLDTGATIHLVHGRILSSAGLRTQNRWAHLVDEIWEQERVEDLRAALRLWKILLVIAENSRRSRTRTIGTQTHNLPVTLDQLTPSAPCFDDSFDEPEAEHLPSTAIAAEPSSWNEDSSRCPRRPGRGACNQQLAIRIAKILFRILFWTLRQSVRPQTIAAGSLAYQHITPERISSLLAFVERHD